MLRASLLEWYDRNRRDLPWRRTKDPYAIWVSEIMLQQTRVAAVIDRYNSFMARFPTVEALAQASEQDVLAQWSGLGYYRRARMLQKAAQVVCANHKGQLPTTAAELRNLAGIGAYTAAAIASIAYRRAHSRCRRQCGTGAESLARLGVGRFKGTRRRYGARSIHWPRSWSTQTAPATSTRR